MPHLILLPLLFLGVLQSSADPLLRRGLREEPQWSVARTDPTVFRSRPQRVIPDTNELPAISNQQDIPDAEQLPPISRLPQRNHPNVTIGPRFDAIDAKYEAETLGLNGSFFIPPDSHGAAGKNSVIAVVNVHIEARNKTGSLLWRTTLKNFFGPVGIQGFGFDPKIVYDSHVHRFVVVCLDSDFSTYSSILLAVSKNGNPATWQASDWYFHKINSLTMVNGEATFADYPGFEVDEEAIYVTNNMFSEITFVQSRLWIVDKGINGGFYGGGKAKVTASLPIGDSADLFLGTYQPAEIRASNPNGAGPGIGTFLVSYDFDGLYDLRSTSEALSIVRVNDPLGKPSLDQRFVNISNIENTFVDLTDAPQSNSANLIQTNDRRVLDAVWHKNALWCVFTIMRDGKARAFWVKLTTDVAEGKMAALVDKGPILGDDISGNRTYTFFPSVAVNNRGVAVFGFSASAQSIYAGAYVTVRDDENDPRGMVRASQVVREGVAPYALSRDRWGDYSGISVDPADENCFWIYNQYAAPLDCRRNATGCWGTGWARLCFH